MNQKFKNLAGQNVKLGKITHNNMVPYFGSSVTQSTGIMGDSNESLLDRYTDKSRIKKKA